MNSIILYIWLYNTRDLEVMNYTKKFKQEFDLVLDLNFYYIENAFQICVSHIIGAFFTKNFLPLWKSMQNVICT